MQADRFGIKYVGANHGRMLLASTGASLSGPALLLWLRNNSNTAAIEELLRKVDPSNFEAKFGVPLSEAGSLIEVSPANEFMKFRLWVV